MQKIKTGYACTVPVASKPIEIPIPAFGLTRADIIKEEGKKGGKFNNAEDVMDDLLNPGNVVLYKTESGNYGQFKVVSIGAKSNDSATNLLLTIDVITYKPDGIFLVNKTGVTIKRGRKCDLDTGTEGNASADFQWCSGKPFVTTSLIPMGSLTGFYLYSN